MAAAAGAYTVSELLLLMEQKLRVMTASDKKEDVCLQLVKLAIKYTEAPVSESSSNSLLTFKNNDEIQADMETMRTLAPLIYDKIQKIDFKGVRGKTQAQASEVEGAHQEVLEQQGYSFTRASSQQPYDFRQIRHGSWDKTRKNLLIESKASTSCTFLLNDTIPKKGVMYTFYNVKDNKMIATDGGSIIDRLSVDSQEKVKSYGRFKDFGRFHFKKFDDCLTSCTRTSYSIKFKKSDFTDDVDGIIYL